MSSRALRRLQKQQEEQRALAEAQKATPEQSDDDDDVQPNGQKSAFAMLNVDENNDNNSDGSEDAADRNAKAATNSPKIVVDNCSQPAPKASKKKKKKPKSKANKTSKTTSAQDSEDDDIDATLAALIASRQREEAAQSAPDTANPLYRLLSVQTANLHAINEMRRLFGRDAMEDAPQPERIDRRQRDRPVNQDGRGFPAISLKRNIFIQGRAEWPRATTGGLAMEVVRKDAESGITEYRFVHSTAYQETQRQYEIAVASMNPDRLVLLLQQNPYHIGTLMSISELMKYNRQHTESGDVLERALFAFGRTVHSTFSQAMSEGKARLSFDRPENREFFLACWRYTLNLAMRSTWRTVYEWTKLLFSLDPIFDPYCLKLVLDQYALRANQTQHYLDLANTTVLNTNAFVEGANQFHAQQYSVALCHLRYSEEDKARQTLKAAMEADRYTAHQLFKTLEIEPVPGSLWGHHEPADDRVELLTFMYTSRAKDMWNQPDARSLLKTVAAMLPKVPQETVKSDPRVSVEVARHVHLTENEEFRRLLSKCQLADNAVLGDQPMQDPYPPDTEVRSYDPRPLRTATSGRAHGLEAAQMNRMLEELARLQMAGEQGQDIGEGEWDFQFDREDVRSEEDDG